MTEIKPIRILKFSSEDDLFPALNLLKNGCTNPWKCKNSLEKEAFVEFEFQEFFNINKIEIGNSNSAFVEILVIDYTTCEYQPLIVSTSLMSSTDSIKGEAGYKTRCFNETQMMGKSRDRMWKCLRVVCSQPFNKSIIFGLSFIRFYGTPLIKESADNEHSNINFGRLMNDNVDDVFQVGSLFSLRSSQPPVEPCQRIITPANNYFIKRDSGDIRTDKSLSLPILCKELTEEVLSSESTIEIQGSDDDVLDNVVSDTRETEDNIDQSCEGVSIEAIRPSTPIITIDLSQGPSHGYRHKQALPSVPSIINDSQCSSNDVLTKRRSHATEKQQDRGPSDERILSGVSFVLSGYQNPLRNILRDNGLALGAKYRASWTSDCTHLICAFANTPKFKEVCGKGIIVSDKWILDCYEKKQHLPWREYRVKGSLSPVKSHSENNDRKRVASGGSDGGASASASVGKRVHCSEQCDTDDEIEMVLSDTSENRQERALSLPTLPTIFSDMTFFLYGDFDYAEGRRLRRLLRVFGGCVCEYMCPQVQVVITTSVWDDTFDEALIDYRHLRFIHPLWVDDCDQRRHLCSLEPYEIRRE